MVSLSARQTALMETEGPVYEVSRAILGPKLRSWLEASWRGAHSAWTSSSSRSKIRSVQWKHWFFLMHSASLYRQVCIYAPTWKCIYVSHITIKNGDPGWHGIVLWQLMNQLMNQLISVGETTVHEYNGICLMYTWALDDISPGNSLDAAGASLQAGSSYFFNEGLTVRHC